MTAVMVHGAGGGGWQWAIWSQVLAAEGIPVLAPDLRPAAAGLEATTWDDYLQQIADWREGLAGERQILVGASLGGLLALACAAQRPPAALVLVNPLPPAGVQPWPLLRPRPPRVEWSRLPFTATRAALPDAALAAARHAHQRWRDESGRVLNAAAAGISLATPACPVLVMAAAAGTDIPAATSRATAARLGADFIEMRGCGHLGVLLGFAAAPAAKQAATWLAGLQGGNCD